MKYLKVLENEAAHQAFKSGSEYVEPHICYLKDSAGIRWKAYVPPPPALVGDVAYWDGSKVKTIPYSKWDGSMGTPIGVVVVPSDFAPDGKPRIISLLYADKSGNTSTSNVGMAWGGYLENALLTRFTKVPTTDNAGSTSTGSSDNGWLPSDRFTGATSFVDPKAKYDVGRTPMIPSPYLGESPNPDYYKEILSGNTNVNAFSDFNGLSNTQTLVSLGGEDYVAANAAWKYKDGASNLQWYLPAMGELGYIMPRLNEINEITTALGGAALVSINGISIFSSSDRSMYQANYINTLFGYVNGYGKNYSTIGVRPFAIL